MRMALRNITCNCGWRICGLHLLFAQCDNGCVCLSEVEGWLSKKMRFDYASTSACLELDERLSGTTLRLRSALQCCRECWNVRSTRHWYEVYLSVCSEIHRFDYAQRDCLEPDERLSVTVAWVVPNERLIFESLLRSVKCTNHKCCIDSLFCIIRILLLTVLV